MLEEMNTEILDGSIKTQLQKDEEELKQYTEQNIAKILEIVEKNSNNRYWSVKGIHASGHGGQNINHGNSKAQLHFYINNFYNDFNINDDTRGNFVKVCGEKKITHDQSVLTLENQETRYFPKNKENVVKHLKQILLEIFKDEKERIQTEISQEIKKERIYDKKKHSEKKHNRKKVYPED